MRTFATGLLVFAAVIYLATLRSARQGWLGYVNAGAEAAMVGAIADWFAVTAIFRHPLGIPIPHTALVKRRKNDLGRSLQNFLANNFLTTDIVVGKVAEAQVSARIAVWLRTAENRTKVLEQVVRGLRAALSRVRDADVSDLITQTVVPKLREKSFSPMVGVFLGKVVAEDGHRPVIDLLARELNTWLTAHPDLVKRVITERVPGWLPGWIDKRLVDYLYQQGLEWTMAVRTQADHPARTMVDRFLTKLGYDLQHDEVTMRRAEDFKNRVLSNEGLGEAVVEVWQSVRESIEGAIDDRGSAVWTRADQMLAHFAERLDTDEGLRASLDGRICAVVSFLVSTYRDDLASIVSTTVERWDADDTSNRIELFVGRDLQFIRINGTVVGALAGLLIHTVSQLMH